MDLNKLQHLRSIGYKVAKVCGLCKHGRFPSNTWGTCAIQTYQHQKHSDSVRELSITVFGSCQKWELDTSKDLGAYGEFLDQ